ncbi:MAG: DUF262 domain-containing protein [Candidatus Moeniiplasma glomeromycotorum]|nr:DUF262 domain-containing protein [Candidatus Moeniiplasma glomeromycotorum]
MKTPEIKKSSFRELMEKEQVAYFSLPLYQREYSWDKENWETFLESARELIEINKEKEQSEVWFIGDIILAKKKKQSSDENISYDIIDGQQRLITIFILLSVIYKKISELDNKETRVIENEITDFLVWKKNELRIILNNQDDKENFQKCIFSNLSKWGKTPEGEGNIFQAQKWFSSSDKRISQEECLNIYETVVNNFFFSLVIIDEETDPWEIFRTLNTTGLELSNSDLVKSLFISRTDSRDKQERVIKKWDREVVKKVSFLNRTKKKNAEIERFLISFLIGHFSLSMQTVIKKDLYKFYKRKIENKKQEEVSSLFQKITEYAEVYEKIIKITTNYNNDWWEKYWPSEMFYSAYEILSLYPNDYFFRPLLLAMHFQLASKSQEEKEIITGKFKKLLMWVFRTTTIKGKVQQKNILRQFQKSLIEDINDKGIFLEDGSWVNNEIQKEFDEENSVDFYRELENYNPKDKHNRSWGFIFRSYYWKKIEVNDNLTNEQKKRLRRNLLEYSIEHLAPQTSRSVESELEKIINNLGNITLLRTVDNSSLSNKDWDEKRFDIKSLGKNCLMNYLEERDWTDVEDINELVEERKKYLIEDFKKFQVFEIE